MLRCAISGAGLSFCHDIQRHHTRKHAFCWFCIEMWISAPAVKIIGFGQDVAVSSAHLGTPGSFVFVDHRHHKLVIVTCDKIRTVNCAPVKRLH